MFKIVRLLIFIAAATEATFEVIPMNSTLPAFLNYTLPNDNVARSKNLHLLSSVSYTGVIALGPTVIIAHRLALQNLKMLPNWLPGYELVFDLFDDGSVDDKVIRNTLTKLRDVSDTKSTLPIMGIIESATFSQIICAHALTSFNVLTTGAYPLPQIFYNKEKFPNFIPYGESQDYYTEAAVGFITEMAWTRVAIISDTNTFNSPVDPYLIDRLDKANVTLLYVGKFIDGNSADTYGLETTFNELSKRQPRIIIQNAWDCVPIACYLHKFGLYGPGFVILSYTWTYFDEKSSIPEFLASWCTNEMLLEVVKSVIYYGDAPLADIYGPNATDSLGMKNDELLNAMRFGVDRVELAVGWEYFSPLYYDRSVLMGFILNRTETMLNQMNMTLSDWTMETENYKRNPQFILDLMKKAMFQTNITGIKGEYSFDAKKKWSSGSMPVIFYQVRVESGKNSKMFPIGYFKSNIVNAKKTVIDWKEIKWQTYNKEAPKDYVKVVDVKVPLLPPHISSTLYAISAGILLYSLVTLAKLLKTERKALAIVPVTTVSMVTSIFLIPFGADNQNIGTMCSIIAGLLVAGFSIFLAFVNMRLSFGILQIRNEKCMTFSKILESIIFAISPIAFMVSLLTDSPIDSAYVIAGESDSRVDESLVYRYLRSECQVLPAFFRSETQIGLVAATAIVTFLSLFRCTLLTVEIQSLIKSSDAVTNKLLAFEMKIWSLFLYGMWLILVAVALIGVVFGDSNVALLELTASAVFVIAVATMLLLTLVLVWKPKVVPVSKIGLNAAHRNARPTKSYNQKASVY